MGMEKLAVVTAEGLRTDLPTFEAGDTVKVMVRVREGDKERLQAFDRLRARACLADTKAFALKAAAQQQPDLGIVLDDQNVRRRRLDHNDFTLR